MMGNHAALLERHRFKAQMPEDDDHFILGLMIVDIREWSGGKTMLVLPGKHVVVSHSKREVLEMLGEDFE